ncbi:MMPL family transporter [Streptomyces sp. NPDC002540]
MGLSVIGIAMLTTLGLAAAVAITVAVPVALALLPATLGFTGTRVANGRLTTRRMRAAQHGRRVTLLGVPTSLCGKGSGIRCEQNIDEGVSSK